MRGNALAEATNAGQAHIVAFRDAYELALRRKDRRAITNALGSLFGSMSALSMHGLNAADVKEAGKACKVALDFLKEEA